MSEPGKGNRLITNEFDIDLTLAVWLLHDEYDYVDGIEKYVSATTLLKPTRQMILGARVDPKTITTDVADYIPRAKGNAFHSAVEHSWKSEGYKRSLRLLGYPEDVIERLEVNPSDNRVRSWEFEQKQGIALYFEQRLYRQIDGWTVGGKFDQVMDGGLRDTKSTSAYSWLMGGKDEDYQLQGSIYRWLDAGQPHRKITEDYIRINFIFTDWQKNLAKSNPNYPQKAIQHKDIPLLSEKETEKWIRSKLALIDKFKEEPQDNLPECSDEELWRSDPQFKYYSDPAKTSGRSTRNFDDAVEARAFMASKGGKGVIKTVPGEPKRCAYCQAFPICTQKDRYFSP